MSMWVQTRIHATEALIKKVDSMVYLFDPAWIGSTARSDVDTLPFVFLEVIKEDVIQNMQVSKKRMILFEPDIPTGVVQKQYRTSVINVVADNVINEPAIYKIEALLPAYDVGNVLSTAANTVSTTIETITDNGAVDLSDPAGSAFRSARGFYNTFAEILRSVVVILNLGGAVLNRILAVTRKFNGNSSEFNRLSLLRMARTRSILKYKTWNSWYTKSVVISGLTMSKIGTEDGYYRVSLELQEVPILHVGKVAGIGSRAALSDIQSVAISNTVKTSFEQSIGKFER
jgi:hypothetical protein